MAFQRAKSAKNIISCIFLEDTETQAITFQSEAIFLMDVSHGGQHLFAHWGILQVLETSTIKLMDFMAGLFLL